MKLTILGAVAVTALLAGCGGGRWGCHANAEERMAKMERFVDKRLNHVLDDLDATAAQRQQIDAAKVRVVAEMKALAAEHQKVRGEVATVFLAPEVDAAKVHALVDQRFDAARAAAHKIADGVLDAQRALNPDQRAKLQARLKEHLDDH